MRLIESPHEITRECRELPRPLGLVPTMGALHKGHLALIRQAKQDNSSLAVSVFVNPTQFNQAEDLSRYPRNLERDLAILEREFVDVVFAPFPEEIYPPGFNTWVDPGPLAERLEGAARPGHFRGVATVVTKLFNLVRPDRAYFGQKDGQQVLVIEQLVRDLNLDIELKILPTVREPDGLAMSSRNANLTDPERQAAPVVFRALRAAQELQERGEMRAEVLKNEARKVLATEPLVAHIDYVSLADCDTLEELDLMDRRAMLSLAVRIGRTRLIDNLILPANR